MEKLIELLNEYENRDDDPEIEWKLGEGDKGENGKVRGIVNEVYMGRVSELVVCSAYYGFIKRLVENDKIDLRKLRKPKRSLGTYWEILLENKSTIDIGLLMLLAIQDEPIEFLISILK